MSPAKAQQGTGALLPPTAKEKPVAATAVVDAAKLTTAKQKDAVAALLAAHPEVREKLGL